MSFIVEASLQLLGLLIVFIGAAAIAKLILGYKTWLDSKSDSHSLENQILDLLPQTQCAQCGHPGCAPYADSIAKGEAHNKCPPGGQALIDTLSQLLNRESMTLDETLEEDEEELIAVIREEECIGCAKCGPVCPIDAIVGANNMMHTVILQDCTGCELCLPPCPVDCIDLVPRSQYL
ncbi:MAG: RnfABCDGE type electron transport complex subunit B [Pseudomonadota bacterium]|nr:RnfABCDGE type electron transport complex subunit B [Pseudomonadota bacterium]